MTSQFVRAGGNCVQVRVARVGLHYRVSEGFRRWVSRAMFRVSARLYKMPNDSAPLGSLLMVSLDRSVVRHLTLTTFACSGSKRGELGESAAGVGVGIRGGTNASGSSGSTSMLWSIVCSS